MTSSVGDQCGY